MDRLSNNQYYKPNLTRDWLLKNNFRYSSILSNDQEEVYTYRFPVHKNGGFTVLECEVSVYMLSHEVMLDVFEYGTRDRYASFYYTEYGNYDTILQLIWNQINKELKKLGIKKKG